MQLKEEMLMKKKRSNRKNLENYFQEVKDKMILLKSAEEYEDYVTILYKF